MVDGKFACRYLIGAGGTHCPVKRQIFPNLHSGDSVALARELEFKPMDRFDGNLGSCGGCPMTQVSRGLFRSRTR